jgi:hypothetical protein
MGIVLNSKYCYFCILRLRLEQFCNLNVIIMENNYIITDKSLQDFYNQISLRTRNGFTLTEKNDKLPFAILSRAPREINHTFNFLLFCLTLGLWSVIWFYLIYVYAKKKTILIAIDEDGKTFEEKCF